MKQDITRKEQINKPFLKPELKFDISDNKEYKVEAIKDSAIYAKKAEEYLIGLYYLVFWKSYLEEKNTWELSSTIMHLQKMISTFYKDYPEKLITIFLSFNSTPSIATPSVKPVNSSVKQK